MIIMGSPHAWEAASVMRRHCGGNQTMARPGGCVWAVAVTADGTTAVSGGADGTVRVWDLASGQEQESPATPVAIVGENSVGIDAKVARPSIDLDLEERPGSPPAVPKRGKHPRHARCPPELRHSHAPVPSQTARFRRARASSRLPSWHVWPVGG